MSNPLNKKYISCDTLLIWDCEEDYPINDPIILWKSYSSEELSHIISIPQIVENNADYLKKKYLAWIYDFGKFKVHGKRVIDHLQFRSGLNYWWMTLLIEKNYGKSLAIYDSIRFIAFVDWLKDQSINTISLKTGNRSLAECIKKLCIKLDITFNCQLIKEQEVELNRYKFIYKNMPNISKGLIWLVSYLIDRMYLRGQGLKKLKLANGRITFFSYLFNLNSEALKKGYFESAYWLNLPDILKRGNYKINWVHIYVPSAQIPTAKQAAKIIFNFNKTGGEFQNHITLDTFLSFKIIFKTLVDWVKLIFVGISLKKVRLIGNELDINLWPLFEKDWQNSLFGIVAMQNLLNYHLLKAMLETLPKQDRGVYLQENQSWEFSLIQVWKDMAHGELIGAPHSTIRFWDLRYFFHPKSFSKKFNYHLPMPNKVALNGPAAISAYKKGGYPSKDLVEVEALRYMHLVRNKNRKVKDQYSKLSSNKKYLHVLVLGDYLIKNTLWQMNMLQQAVQYLPVKMIFIVKPHPACLINSGDYPKIEMVLDSSPIEKLLAKCDVVFTGTATSAIVDAYFAGIPVVSALDPKILNLNPLRGYPKILFVKTPKELAGALKQALYENKQKMKYKTFFTLDISLCRWRKLLELN